MCPLPVKSHHQGQETDSVLTFLGRVFPQVRHTQAPGKFIGEQEGQGVYITLSDFAMVWSGDSEAIAA